MSILLESAYFGETLGEQQFYQLPFSTFQSGCLSEHSGDNTGLRVYSGAHVAARFLANQPGLLMGQSIIELGCGVGAMSILGCKNLTFKKLMLTDGQDRAIDIVKMNIDLHFAKDKGSIVKCKLLVWSNDETITEAIDCLQSDSFYNVILGCELMYYSTEVKDLVYTVMKLSNYTGLFIHIHVFRKYEQPKELIEELEKYNWTSLEIPISSFIPLEHLDSHPDWYNVRSLISGPRDKIESLMKEHQDWIIFTAEAIVMKDEYSIDSFNLTSVFG